MGWLIALNDVQSVHMKSLFAAKAPLYVHLKPPISIYRLSLAIVRSGQGLLCSNSHEILSYPVLDVMNRLYVISGT